MLVLALLACAIQRPPDVVFLIADDFGSYDLEHIDTPNLDRLAATGICFTRTYANIVCTPSRDSFLTGMWSNRFYENTCTLGTNTDFGVQNLGNILDAAGFETAFFGKWHLGQSPVASYRAAPHLWGFETARAWNTDGIRTACVTASLEALGMPTGTLGNYTLWPTIDDGIESLSTRHNTDAIVDAFQAWNQEPRGTDPRAAVVSFNTPHKPFYWPTSQGLEPPGATDRDKFEAMVRDMDRAIGKVLRSIPENAWVFFFGDNGTDNRARAPAQPAGKLKATTYEGGVRVPMIWRGPRILPGTSSDALVHVADILPTVMQLFHTGDPSALDGRSLVPLLMNPDAPSPHRYVYVGGRPSVGAFRQAVISHSGWKLQSDLSVAQVLTERLFDLTNDPDELLPIDPQTAPNPGLVAELRGVLADAEQRALR